MTQSELAIQPMFQGLVGAVAPTFAAPIAAQKASPVPATDSKGRAGGIWDLGGDAVFFVFEQLEGRGLLDEVVALLDPADGTPIP